MSNSFTIKQVTRDELPATIAWFADNYYIDDSSEAALHFADHENDGGTTFLAHHQDQIAGFVTIRWQSENPHFKAQNIPLIHHLDVFEPFKRQGLGNRLLAPAETCIAQRATHAGITVGVFNSYGPAQRLYAKRGYIPDGRGVCKGDTPLQLGEVHQIDHNLIMWLTKDLRT